MPGLKTNEVAGTRAVVKHYRMSAYKAREVLDLVRGRDVDHAEEILRSTPREAARVVEKVLTSAVANARNNDLLDPDELYVSACFADEGTTMKRWRPRARGRATRIRKRTCHITVIVSRLPDDRLERRRARQSDAAAAMRARRVAASRRQRRGGAATEETEVDAALDASDTGDTGAAIDETTDTDVEEAADTDVEEAAGTDAEVTDGAGEGADETATTAVAEPAALAEGTEGDTGAEEGPAAAAKKAKAAKKAAPARKRARKAAADDDAAEEEKD
jgi:large subunit ribosomal protein L22